jgi:hypothetical protein
MMMAGAILVAAGFIGLAFHRNRNVETTRAAPRARHAEAAEAVFATDLLRSNKDCGLNFFHNLLPLSSIESLTRLNGNDLLILEREHDSTASPRLRKIKRVRVGFAAVKLAGAADTLIEKQPQLVRIKVRPSFTEKIFGHDFPSPIARQLPAAPMMVFAIGIEHPLDVPIAIALSGS